MDVKDTQLISDTLRLISSLGQLPEAVAEPVFVAVSGLPGTGANPSQGWVHGIRPVNVGDLLHYKL